MKDSRWGTGRRTGTISQCLAELAEKYPDQPMVIDSRVHTYGEMLADAEKTAGKLQEAGVRKGDRVVVSMGNRIEYLYLTFALAALGAVKVSVGQSIGPVELDYILEETGAGTAVLEKGSLAAYAARSHPRMTVISMETEEQGKGTPVLWEDFWQDDRPGTVVANEQDENEVCDIIYTSGTSGCPKGVMLTHRMLLLSAHASCLNRSFERGRRIYIPIPLYHVYGYVEGLLAAMLAAGSIVITPGKFDAGKGLDAMERWAVNDILSVPLIMIRLLRDDSLSGRDLTALHAVYCSASVCPDWVWDGIQEKLGVREITTGYGMTEVSGAAVQNEPGDLGCLYGGYLGKVLPGGVIEYRVVKDTGEELPPGVPGELVCRGPMVTKGYFHQEGYNRKVFDEAGWFHTGDIGCFTEDGYLKFIGRKNDSYKINGENVSPQFLDMVLARCPEVVTAETVGLPDPKRGWTGAAFVETADNREAAREAVRRFCEKALAPWQVPEYFFFGSAKQWPRTANGKIQKNRLRQIAQTCIAEAGERGQKIFIL